MNFKQRNTDKFDLVCRILGEGWRINKLDEYDHQIKLTSPDYKHYSIFIREQKGRLIINGSVDYRYYSYSKGQSCSVSLTRPVRQLAADIKKKILTDAHERIAEAVSYRNKMKSNQDEDSQVKALLGKLVDVSDYYNRLCAFNHKKIRGSVDCRFYRDFDVEITNLDKEQLFKLMGFISTL